MSKKGSESPFLERLQKCTIEGGVAKLEYTLYPSIKFSNYLKLWVMVSYRKKKGKKLFGKLMKFTAYLFEILRKVEMMGLTVSVTADNILCG